MVFYTPAAGPATAIFSGFRKYKMTSRPAGARHDRFDFCAGLDVAAATNAGPKTQGLRMTRREPRMDGDQTAARRCWRLRLAKRVTSVPTKANCSAVCEDQHFPTASKSTAVELSTAP